MERSEIVLYIYLLFEIKKLFFRHDLQDSLILCLSAVKYRQDKGGTNRIV